jgi:hypothetical protein
VDRPLEQIAAQSQQARGNADDVERAGRPTARLSASVLANSRSKAWYKAVDAPYAPRNPGLE